MSTVSFHYDAVFSLENPLRELLDAGGVRYTVERRWYWLFTRRFNIEVAADQEARLRSAIHAVRADEWSKEAW